jgi:putative Holliday junction resolvase
MDLPPATVLAVDLGTVRTGVAASDPGGALASPVATLTGDPGRPDPSTAVLDQVVLLADRFGAGLVVVGWPLGLSGGEGAAARAAREFAEALASRIDVPVRLVDERLTTATAQGQLRAAGRTGRRGRTARRVVDQAAAVVLLQHVLDAAASGVDVGRPVGAGAGAA